MYHYSIFDDHLWRTRIGKMSLTKFKPLKSTQSSAVWLLRTVKSEVERISRIIGAVIRLGLVTDHSQTVTMNFSFTNDLEGKLRWVWDSVWTNCKTPVIDSSFKGFRRQTESIWEQFLLTASFYFNLKKKEKIFELFTWDFLKTYLPNVASKPTGHSRYRTRQTFGDHLISCQPVPMIPTVE